MNILKRNGSIVEFNINKINTAIKKAMLDSGVDDEILRDKVTEDTYGDLLDDNKDLLYIEDIQDLVENNLMKNGLTDVARNYILYREKRKETRDKQATLYQEAQEKISDIMNMKNIENSNANVDEGSFSGKNSKVTSHFLKEYALNNLMDKRVAQAHREGTLYTHDLDNYCSGMHNCVERSTRFITDKGTKSFEDFNDGDKIRVLTHTGEFKNATVRCYGEQMLNEIVLSKGGKVFKTVRATDNHRWLLKNGKFTEDLKVGDVLYSCPDIVDFDYDNANENEQRYWRMGFAVGDGTIDGNWNRHENKRELTNRVKIRLCGDKIKYLNRFKANDCKICDEKLDGEDVIIKLYDYDKSLPKVDKLTYNELKAFVDGLYCADGYKTSHYGIQFTNKELIEFVDEYFEPCGYYITTKRDKTGQVTPLTDSNGRKFTVEFSFTCKPNKFSYKVKEIKPYKVEEVWCLDVEDNHTFVISGGIVTGNCLNIDFQDLFENNNGFETRNGDVRKPNNIMTFFQLVAVTFQCQSQVQFGGVGSNKIDYDGAPYVAITFKKCFKDALMDVNNITEETANKIISNIEFAYGDIIKLENPIIKVKYKREYDVAKRHTEKKTLQGAESLYHNLNTLESRAGSQVPFTSINFGTDTSPEGRLVSKALLQASINGIGKFNRTSIFPISIFKYKKGVNDKPGTPNYDLKQLALKSLSKRIYPNFCNVDISYQDECNSPDEEFATMGCRTLLGYDINGMGWKRGGRGNIAPVTMNLVDLGIKNGICLGERNTADINGFWKDLDELLNLAEIALLDRYEWICSQKAKSGYFMYRNGTMKSLLGRRLNNEEEVREVMKHNTLALGYIGVAECMKAMFGKHHGEDDKVYDFAYAIVEKIYKFTKNLTKKHHLNFSCYATPAESTCMTLRNKLVEKYGVIEGVTDRDYITNSHHIPVYYNISIMDKIDKESKFSHLCTGGFIEYVELNSTFMKNLKAIEKIIDYAMSKDAAYFALNFPIDTCGECGYSDEIKDNCPKCGSNNIERLRRVTGYLTTDYKNFNDGKIDEVKDRVKHEVGDLIES